ncbi:hypothetical protein ASPVEDRAFT_374817 [Aspergillus versicolor CBS 583.65]|uniref:Uncharacterized protein n=1 Tax=Aspergillus versicolor CBS 583.65 TaxID=1036611 RepID=A0A1L9Q233_ASPVE|nr:uncharacterized protein ASPVEDRAFT_374817 [Aspergillus versicolor CBS 583.65]OJJ07798.1 hypothetical protein ASPVEDRAFT_374817 [Aspergillus versicolor CBS 583.65]
MLKSLKSEISKSVNLADSEPSRDLQPQTHQHSRFRFSFMFFFVFYFTLNVRLLHFSNRPMGEFPRRPFLQMDAASLQIHRVLAGPRLAPIASEWGFQITRALRGFVMHALLLSPMSLMAFVSFILRGLVRGGQIPRPRKAAVPVAFPFDHSLLDQHH